MKVSFIISPKAKNKIKFDLDFIYDTIHDLGHSHTFENAKDVDPGSFYQPDSEQAKSFFGNVEKSIKNADICIFETTVPSLGLGHLIYQALSQGKPVIVLHQGDKLPLLLSELEESRVQVLQYTSENIKEVLSEAIDYAKDQADTRFNFFISPKHSNYLDWIAKNRRVPRSVYLRNLIKQDMSENKEYA